MVLETIATEMGEEAILIDGGDASDTKIASTPISQQRTSEDFENIAPVAETRDESPEYEKEAPQEHEGPHVPPPEPSVVEFSGTAVNATETEIEIGQEQDERDFDKNPTVLFALLQKKEWQAAIERSNVHQDEAKVWVSRKEKDGRLRWRLLPIHAAIVFKAPEDVIEALLAAYPKGAHAKDDQGMLPLHLAFRNGSSEDIVNLLLTAFPQSIDVKDRKGRTPLVLAQASTSPNKDSYLRALERGPAYYIAAAAENDRAALIAEQRTIFNAELMQVHELHQQEIATIHEQAAHKESELLAKIAEMEKELAKTHETSQVLVDHVNSLEAQLSSRSDTERFLATKIATLDSSLKTTEKERVEIEQALKFENITLTAERDGYKAKLDEIEKEYGQVHENFRGSIEVFERREQEWSKTKSELEQQIKSVQIDWANAQANCAILDVQLKRKMETEHALATQVSSLASKLAEAASDSREFSTKFSKKIKDLEEERFLLRNTVQDLTKRLKLVATVLEDMTNEQTRIISQSKTQDSVIIEALASHAKIVADAREQQKFLDEARREREEMQKKLAKQEEAIALNEEKRVTILNAIAIQGEHMEKTKNARDNLLESVENMGKDVKGVLENILSVLPTDIQKEDELVDAVVKNISCPVIAEEIVSQRTEPKDVLLDETNNDETRDD